MVGAAPRATAGAPGRRHGRAAAKGDLEVARAAASAVAEAARLAARTTRWVLLSTTKQRGAPEVGERVQGKYQGVIGGYNWFGGVVRAARHDGSFDLLYDDGDEETAVLSKFVKVWLGPPEAAAEAAADAADAEGR